VVALFADFDSVLAGDFGAAEGAVLFFLTLVIFFEVAIH
jgi:hypothetical protein